MQTEFFFDLYNVHRPCVHKVLHLAFTKASRADMQTQNLHENNSRTQICSPHLRCAPEKGPRQYRTTTQNDFMISTERQKREATNTTKNYFSVTFLLLCLSFSCSTKARHSFWMISAAKEMRKGGEGRLGRSG